MLFFKVKPGSDQARRKDGSILVGGELYTQKEKEKFQLEDKHLEPVNISKFNTFWFFGARREKLD